VNAAVNDEALWKPSKYVRRRGRLMASRDVREVGIGSRLNADLVAAVYDRELRLHARGRLLDLGCGKVPLHDSYKDFVSGSVCVDWANTAHKNPHLDLECDLTQALPFADLEFETILLSDVLEHIPLVAVPFVGKPAAAALQWLARAWWRTGLGTRLARRTGRKFPLGYFLVARKNG
jgi:2-polyprenyl-3-methyl-5-hydroxy-6-metoxy-1,4-benzoquinol methylase